MNNTDKPQTAFVVAASFAFKSGINPTDPAGNVIGDLTSANVNIAFACEVYLKCLHYILGRQIRGHKLEELFFSLPNTQQSHVVDHYGRCCDKLALSLSGAERLVARTRDFPVMLNENSDTFTRWRYKFQEDEFELKCYGLHVFAQSLQKTILDVRPEWVSFTAYTLFM